MEASARAHGGTLVYLSRFLIVRLSNVTNSRKVFLANAR
jgi:hypothetical protein